jgi:hypothetical protein
MSAVLRQFVIVRYRFLDFPKILNGLGYVHQNKCLGVEDTLKLRGLMARDIPVSRLCQIK